MQISPSRAIKRVLVPKLTAEKAEYFRIVQDMLQNSGDLLPDPNWLEANDVSHAAETYDRQKALKVALSDEAFEKRFSQLDVLLKAWIGNARSADEKAQQMYRGLLETWDPLGLWEHNIRRPSAVNLLEADLGSIMDLNLIYSFASDPERKKTTLLEVGGGYGRLAEATFNIFGSSVKYVLIDAVPASLYYAKHYLMHACPKAKIGSYYDGPDFDMEKLDIAIVPAWAFEKINRYSYDICVNIESMQEMNQRHVDHYISLFDRLSQKDATIYISNARDYYFRGQWNFPAHWQLLFSHNTPRSWTRDHPTQIFRKSGAECVLQRAAVEAGYRYNLPAPQPLKATSPSIKRRIASLGSAVRKRVSF